MKKKFSKSWKSSSQPRKQRKYLKNAHITLKKKNLSANLSKELRKKYEKRSVPLRKGDTVKIMNGKMKNKTGKITEINVNRPAIFIEGIQIKKQDGSKTNIGIHPSNLQIIELNLEDSKRKRKTEEKIEKRKTEK